ncbi:MAG: hypothetical protein EPN22_01310 [Nitrospirae bacterium]|nr:MAG: hypothetical protein EPN22_01310 [Nitrospirota bacterium]
MNYKILIALVLAGGIAIITAAVFIGIEKRDMVVADDPYQEGLNFDQTLKKYKELGWSVAVPAVVKLGESKLTLMVSDKDGGPLEGAEITFTANPMGTPDVRNCRCSAAGAGRYEAAVPFDRKGYWDITVKVSFGKETLKFSNKLNVEG